MTATSDEEIEENENIDINELEEEIPKIVEELPKLRYPRRYTNTWTKIQIEELLKLMLKYKKNWREMHRNSKSLKEGRSMRSLRSKWHHLKKEILKIDPKFVRKFSKHVKS